MLPLTIMHECDDNQKRENMVNMIDDHIWSKENLKKYAEVLIYIDGIMSVGMLA